MRNSIILLKIGTVFMYVGLFSTFIIYNDFPEIDFGFFRLAFYIMALLGTGLIVILNKVYRLEHEE